MSLEDRFDKHLEAKEARLAEDHLKAAERQEKAIDQDAASLRLINLLIQPALDKAAFLFKDKLGAKTQVALGQDTSTGVPRRFLFLAVKARRTSLLGFLFYPEKGMVEVIQKCTSQRLQEPTREATHFEKADAAWIERVVDSFVEWSLSTL